MDFLLFLNPSIFLALVAMNLLLWFKLKSTAVSIKYFNETTIKDYFFWKVTSNRTIGQSFQGNNPIGGRWQIKEDKEVHLNAEGILKLGIKVGQFLL